MRPPALEQRLELGQIPFEERRARVRLPNAREMFARPRRPWIDLDVEDSRESLAAVANRNRQPERAVLRLDAVPVPPTVLVVLDIVVVDEHVGTPQLIEEAQPGEIARLQHDHGGAVIDIKEDAIFFFFFFFFFFYFLFA